MHKEFTGHVRSDQKGFTNEPVKLESFSKVFGAELVNILAAHNASDDVDEGGFAPAGLAIENEKFLRGVVPKKGQAHPLLNEQGIFIINAALDQFV
jgi:hypothetical protein